MTQTTTGLTAGQARIGGLLDALDLDPIACKLMHPHPGEDGMTLAEADRVIAAYRCYLKICAWYPHGSVVPSRDIDEVWHAHILDTGKYAADCIAVFGTLLHHFPYLGLRGPEDVTAWHAAYERTRDLFRQHFGIDLPAGRAAGTCHNGGSSCTTEESICSNEQCDRSMAAGTVTMARPRPDRSGS